MNLQILLTLVRERGALSLFIRGRMFDFLFLKHNRVLVGLAFCLWTDALLFEDFVCLRLTRELTVGLAGSSIGSIRGLLHDFELVDERRIEYHVQASFFVHQQWFSLLVYQRNFSVLNRAFRGLVRQRLGCRQSRLYTHVLNELGGLLVGGHIARLEVGGQ